MTDRHLSTRERILSAAEKLFAEKGYKETTTREIVREAGASLSSLQTHFQGKENVYFEVRCLAIEELYQFMRPNLDEVAYMDSRGLLHGETAWNLLYELLSKYTEWCFNPSTRHAITLISRELLDGAPVQGLPEEKVESCFAAVQLLCRQYVGVEDADWVLPVGITVFSTMMNMSRTSYRNTCPEAVHFRLPQSQEQVKYQVKNYILLTLRAYLDIQKAELQKNAAFAPQTDTIESK